MTGATLDLLLVGAGWTVAGLGAILLALALFRDRARGRRRCPKCWYDMKGTPGLTCPECGRTVRRESRLFKTRRRWRMALVAAFIALLGVGTLVTPKMLRDGWMSVVPIEVLVFFVPRAGEDEVLDAATQMMVPHPVAAEIARRAKASEVWSDWVWRRLLTRARVVQASPQWFDGEYVVVEATLPWWLRADRMSWSVSPANTDDAIVVPVEEVYAQPEPLSLAAPPVPAVGAGFGFTPIPNPFQAGPSWSISPFPPGTKRLRCRATLHGVASRDSTAKREITWTIPARSASHPEAALTRDDDPGMDEAALRALDIRAYPADELWSHVDGLAVCVWVNTAVLSSSPPPDGMGPHTPSSMGVATLIELMHDGEVVEVRYAPPGDWDGTSARPVPAGTAVFKQIPDDEMRDETLRKRWAIRVRGIGTPLMRDAGKTRYWPGHATIPLEAIVIKHGVMSPSGLWRWRDPDRVHIPTTEPPP